MENERFLVHVFANLNYRCKQYKKICGEIKMKEKQFYSLTSKNVFFVILGEITSKNT